MSHRVVVMLLKAASRANLAFAEATQEKIMKYATHRGVVIGARMKNPHQLLNSGMPKTWKLKSLPKALCFVRMPCSDCWRSEADGPIRRVFDSLTVLFDGRKTSAAFFWRTAVNGVLALGATFVIITAGIDLSVGTVMTFSAVMTAVFITLWKLLLSLGRAASWVAAGALLRFNQWVNDIQDESPAFVCYAGHVVCDQGTVVGHLSG